MKYFIHVVLLALVPLVFGGQSLTDNVNIQRYLDSVASSGYNKRIPPVTDKGSGLGVTVSAYILDVYKMDDSNMDFTAEFYFRQSWNDSRLEFKDSLKEALPNGITLGDIKDIWTPDLFFVEERQGLLHQIVHPNIFCKIRPNGEVFVSIRLTVKFSCPMQFQYFPHDIQECSIKAESYGFQKKDIHLTWYEGTYNPLSYSENITMLEFELIKVVGGMREITVNTGTYSGLTMNFTFKRKIGFFTTRLYLPSVLLILLTSVSFWIKAEQKCLRLALLLVILYLMVSLSTSINSVIPKTSYTKASDVWIGFCHFFVFSAFLEFIVVGVIAGKNSEKGSSESRGDIALTLDPEGKEHNLSDSPKSPLTKVIHMFDARRGGKNTLSLRIDTICSIVFPTVFVIFIIIYFSIYVWA